MKRSSMIAFSAIVIACGEPAPVQDTAAGPASILAAADSCAQAVQQVEYRFEVYGSGDFSSMPAFSGTARLVRETSETPAAMWVRFDPDTLETGEQMPDLTISTDGVTAWALDRTSKWFGYGAISEGGSDLLETAYPASMMEFAIDGPFQAELAGDSMSSEGVDTIGGVACNVVFVEYEGGQGSARWYIGADDNLPRRVDRAGMNGATGYQTLEISELNTAPTFTPADFVLQAPDTGYTVETYRAVLEIGSEAPDWTLQTTEGETLSLSDLRGEVVVLDFWATWCGPCAMAMPGLQALSEELSAEPFRVIGVNTWENADPAAFADENGITYTIVVAGDSVAAEYGVTAIPTFYVISPEGTIAWGGRGFDEPTEQALRTAVETELANR